MSKRALVLFSLLSLLVLLAACTVTASGVTAAPAAGASQG